MNVTRLSRYAHLDYAMKDRQIFLRRKRSLKWPVVALILIVVCSLYLVTSGNLP